MRITLGRTVATPAALEAVSADEIRRAMDRHVIGDWGEVAEGDEGLNDEALEHGDRLFSVYATEAGIKFWIITEADRSATTVLLPSDY